MFYVNHRWLGGTLTNWVTLQKSIKRLKLLKAMVEDGRMAQFSKKEGARLERELKHLQQNFAGVENMATPPDVMFVIDPNSEVIAVREARRMGIPVVAIVDTNCDPDLVTGWFPATTMRCARFACSLRRFPMRCSWAASRSSSRRSPTRRSARRGGEEGVDYVDTSAYEVYEKQEGDFVEGEPARVLPEEAGPVATENEESPQATSSDSVRHLERFAAGLSHGFSASGRRSQARIHRKGIE